LKIYEPNVIGFCLTAGPDAIKIFWKQFESDFQAKSNNFWHKKQKKQRSKQQFLTKHSKNNITHKRYNVIYSVFPMRFNIIYNYKCFWKEKKISF
jgi:hypothetical protein